MKKTFWESVKPRYATSNRCPVTQLWRLLLTVCCCWRPCSPSGQAAQRTTRLIQGGGRTRSGLPFSTLLLGCVPTATKRLFRASSIRISPKTLLLMPILDAFLSKLQTTDGSRWIVQVQPTDGSWSILQVQPTDGSWSILQVQPTHAAADDPL